MLALTGCYFDIDNCGYPRELRVSADGGTYTLSGDENLYFDITDGRGNFGHTYWEYDNDDMPGECDDDDDTGCGSIHYGGSILDWLTVTDTEPAVLIVEPNKTGKERRLYLHGNRWVYMLRDATITVIQSK